MTLAPAQVLVQALDNQCSCLLPQAPLYAGGLMVLRLLAVWIVPPNEFGAGQCKTH